MSQGFELTDDGGTRRLQQDDFPLAFPEDSPRAHIGLSENRLFVQPTDGSRVSVNGAPVSTSAWLHDGDVVEAGSVRLRVENGALRVTKRLKQRSGGAIQPAAFEPASFAPERARSRFRPLALAFWGVLALLGLFGWFVFTARSVSLEFQPAPDAVEVNSKPFVVALGEHYLLRPGGYTVKAEKAGYRTLEARIDVTGDRNQLFRFTLERLPGRLAISTTPSDGAIVSIDGREVGSTPLEPVELPPGEHHVVIRAERHREFEATVSVGGESTLTTLEAVLDPLWASITFLSEPAGATVLTGGRARGSTPMTVDLAEGPQDYEIALSGYKPHRGRVQVEARKSQTIGPVPLVLADGTLKLLSVPGESNVTVDGTYRGQTPLELDVSPGTSHRVELTRSGYESKALDVEVPSGEIRTMTVELEARSGDVLIAADPPDAELFVDGEPRGAASQTLRLVAVPHRITIRKEGYESYETTVTPRPGLSLTVEVALANLAQKKAAALPKVLQSSRGHEMRLVEPRRFSMGASRREPGRRANEALRDVEITRPFYMGATEVSNRQYREFKSAHRSGALSGHNLEIDHHPVVRVGWKDAAEYCNWLSAQESLAPAYQVKGSELVLADPPTNGYRLPTEAEWSLAARYATGEALKYPWGMSLPPEPGSGNFADLAAQGLVVTTLAGYNDGFGTTAPVDSFPANALGIHNLGGNVAEWTNDRYAINPGGGTGVETDPLGPTEGEFHVIRGSSYLHGSVTELRLSYRDYGSEPRPDLGFRIARWAEVTP
ncbi:MAG TPA: PEGA domain-containing protein [Vicinamibacteria bacterium]|nr:PEGA domain-containing protein [Vicinamibacteria bacterium]